MKNVIEMADFLIRDCPNFNFIKDVAAVAVWYAHVLMLIGFRVDCFKVIGIIYELLP